MIFNFPVEDLKGLNRHSETEDRFVTLLADQCLSAWKAAIPILCACHNGGKGDSLGANTDPRFLIQELDARKGPFNTRCALRSDRPRHPPALTASSRTASPSDAGWFGIAGSPFPSGWQA